MRKSKQVFCLLIVGSLTSNIRQVSLAIHGGFDWFFDADCPKTEQAGNVTITVVCLSHIVLRVLISGSTARKSLN